jgi:alkanesulfonate monooxygenase SsuD/methylene tetrahydromethanopterin reductase-like flavin-dependent oxidoreductase (luciferase family)/FAD/FMN-containing dehydrogenase
MDYGHALKLGTFITPTNAAPDVPVGLARLSEELGYDLVTFQDHPYQPRFLDTWTLMTWVAAQTQRIGISANVLNVPMRPPAVTARAAASLDLLSGGRFDLALGAGGFWDAMEAMGARRLTPGQAVDALSEALDVIHGIWDAGERTPLRVDGEFYRLSGAKRGPAPAHDIPIWLGAYKPRMLRLIGEKADGWLPSFGYLKPGQLAAGMATIDEAAAAAGRDPREIRRLLNITGRFSRTRGGFLDGPAEQWVDELLSLALEDGVGTFILGTDDPQVLTQFAEEVAPALRDAVARERASTGVSSATVRSSAIRARRRDGIDYDGLPSSLTAIEPGDAGYAGVRSTYIRGGSPGLVIQAGNTAEVVDALAFARQQPVPLAVRSGGHGISGRSTNDGGIVIDLSRLNSIEVVDEATRRVRIGAGARWSDVAAAIAPYGWALSSGDYGGVGVGGLATAGGVGWLVREHGLTIDHLRAVEVVLADGSLVRATEIENAELFWGIRGAGSNLGIVTSFEFEVDEVGDVGFGQFVFDAGDTAGFLEKWGAFVEAAPRDLTSFMIMGRARAGQPAMAQVYAVVDSDDPEVVVDRLQPLVQIAPLLDQAAQILPYAQIMNVPPSAHNGQGDPVARSGLIEHITPAFAADAARLIASGAVYFFQIRSVGGAVADVHPDATAYAHRSANFSVTAFGADRDRVNLEWDRLYPHFSGLYVNFETDLRPERLDDAYPGATMLRLRDLKSRYDPDNVFRDNFNVTPAALTVA